MTKKPVGDGGKKDKKRTALVLVLFTTFVLVASGVAPFPAITVDWSNVYREDSTRYTPSFTTPLERELVLVYFGSAACGWSNHPDLPSVIDSAKVAVRGHATVLGASFSAVGIAIDWNTKDGVEHLEKIGHFDEVATGRITHGLGVRAYQGVFEGTPQISVLERTMLNPRGEAPIRYEERELIRHTSPGRIAHWVRRGTPIPMRTD